MHEIKHDGYRLIVRRGGKAVRLLTRRGYDRAELEQREVAAVGTMARRAFPLKKVNSKTEVKY